MASSGGNIRRTLCIGIEWRGSGCEFWPEARHPDWGFSGYAQYLQTVHVLLIVHFVLVSRGGVPGASFGLRLGIRTGVLVVKLSISNILYESLFDFFYIETVLTF